MRKKEPEAPKDVNLIVSSRVTGEWIARKMSGVYEVDVNRAIKGLEKELKRKWPDDFQIRCVEVGDE